MPHMPPPGYALEKHSSIIAIGLTVHNAPVELREKLAVPEAEWPRAIDELCAFPHIEEAAVLSTCNRMELYVSALSFHRGVREVEEWMVQASGVPLEELRPYLFLLRDRDATNHLLRVSGGLDSLVMGEGQILAQVENPESCCLVDCGAWCAWLASHSTTTTGQASVQGWAELPRIWPTAQWSFQASHHRGQACTCRDQHQFRCRVGQLCCCRACTAQAANTQF